MPWTTRSIRRSPSLLLLISLVVLMLAAPGAQESILQSVLLLLLFAFVLVTAIFAIAGATRQRKAAVLLAGIWLVISIVDLFVPSEPIKLLSQALFMAFALFVVWCLLARVVTAKEVDFEVLCASPSIYLLLAIVWAVSYDMLFTVDPSYFMGLDPNITPVLVDFLYFSLVTITTLGYGDITPVDQGVRIWAALEAVVGGFYMAVLVARLVSLYRR